MLNHTLSEGGSASRPTQPDRLAILCTWSSKEGGRRSGPARLLLPGKPKKWQLATSEQVVLGLRAEHLDKKQQVAVLKKSSRAGKLQRAAAPRVGRRLNSSALFCSVVSLVLSKLPPQYHGGGVERAHLRKLPHADRQRQPFNQGGVGRWGGGQVGVWDYCSLQTMPGDGGDGRNLEQLLLSLEKLRSDLEQYPDQPRSQTISRPTLHRSRFGRWIATRFLKTV